MFSQFSQLVNAVEHLAQGTGTNNHPQNGSATSNAPAGDTQSPRSSVDEGRRSLSLNPLGDASFFNIRKTLLPSRSGTPEAAAPAPKQAETTQRPVRRGMTLEERLRASFVLGEASERTTPDRSKAQTPVMEVDPASVALPQSPGKEPQTPSLDAVLDPLGATMSPPPIRSPMSPPPVTPTAIQTSQDKAEMTTEPTITSEPADEKGSMEVVASGESKEDDNEEAKKEEEKEEEKEEKASEEVPKETEKVASAAVEPTTAEGKKEPETATEEPQPSTAAVAAVESFEGSVDSSPEVLASTDTSIESVEEDTAVKGMAEATAAPEDIQVPIAEEPSNIPADETSAPSASQDSPAAPATAEADTISATTETLVAPVSEEPSSTPEEPAAIHKTEEVPAAPTTEEPSVSNSTEEPSVAPAIASEEYSAAAIPAIQETAATPPAEEPSLAPAVDQPSAPTPPLTPQPSDDKDTDIEKLRERLKLVEQRFADVSTSFKRLQAEKRVADQVLKDLTPVESITDVEGLRDHFKNLELKTQLSTEEIKRLNGKIAQHDIRLEELRDIHRLESASQSDQIERLKKQLAESEALLKASEEGLTQSKAESEKLKTDLEKSKSQAKAEEEKGTKALGLLKTVRTKMLKVEKEKEELAKELAGVREKEREEREKERQERARLEGEVERMRNEKEREVQALKGQFEMEMSAMKDRYEKEMGARKGQFELEAITTKATHNKELAAKQSRITSLESTVKSLSAEKDSLFDQLQMRQAELESSQSHLESVEARSTELQYQLREAESRIELLTEELTELRTKGLDSSSNPSQMSAEDLSRIISETESKYEARISELRQRMRSLEKERQEAEEEWSRNVQGRSAEVERLREVLEKKEKEYADSIRLKDGMEKKIQALEGENRKLRGAKEAEDGVVKGLRKDVTWLKEMEATLKQEKEEILSRLQAVEKQLEEAKGREATLKSSNKSLKEELKKVQSSAALLERQRNPGIGYWSSSPRHNSFTQSAVELQSTASPSTPTQAQRTSLDQQSAPGSPRGSTTSLATVKSNNDDEEVNLEYIRNVILQFLEHKEMRPNLVRVLSIILHFTPQETRRLIAKV